MSEFFTIKTLAHLRPLLIAYRKKAGLSQSAIAQKLGITQQSYAELEARPESASFERLFRLFNLLDAEFALAEQVSNKVSSTSQLPGSDKELATVRSAAAVLKSTGPELVKGLATAIADTTPPRAENQLNPPRSDMSKSSMTLGEKRAMGPALKSSGQSKAVVVIAKLLEEAPQQRLGTAIEAMDKATAPLGFVKGPGSPKKGGW
ncbi:MAG: helix-turn-helix domain-containing protein [Iodobacter sp.]